MKKSRRVTQFLKSFNCRPMGFIGGRLVLYPFGDRTDDRPYIQITPSFGNNHAFPNCITTYLFLLSR
jgi:hypothetical protein